MTMAFAIVALTAVNLDLVLRAANANRSGRHRSSPTLDGSLRGGRCWAAVELNMLQRLLDTVELTGAQWASSSCCRSSLRHSPRSTRPSSSAGSTVHHDA